MRRPRPTLAVVSYIVSIMAVGQLPGQTIPSGVVASAGGVDIVFTPDSEPLLDGRLIGGTLSLTSSTGTSISGIEDLLFERLHQVGINVRDGNRWPVPAVGQINPFGGSPLYDTQLLLRGILDGTGKSIIFELNNIWNTELYETGFNDPLAFNPAGIESSDPALVGTTYRGDLYYSGAFSLLPNDQSSSVELARIVGMPGERSSFRLNVLGDGFESCSNGVGACFQFDLDWGDALPNLAPTVELNAFELPEVTIVGKELILKAQSIADADGTVDFIEFFANDQRIPNCSFKETPYTCSWIPPRGDYSLTVRATDNFGKSSSSAGHEITVNPERVRIQDGVLQSRGGVDVVFSRDSESLFDGALIGGTLSLRTSTPGGSIVTFNKPSLEEFHQVALVTVLGEFAMPTVSDSLLSADQALFDTHVLITREMIGGSAGGHAFNETGLTESSRDPADVEARIPPSDLGSAVVYSGSILSEGAFFLTTESQGDTLAFARIVGVPGTSSFVTLNVLGSGFQDCGATSAPRSSGGAANRQLPIVAGACFDFEVYWGDAVETDYDSDGRSSVADLNALVAALADSDFDDLVVSEFDVTGDGVVNRSDLDQWLVMAAKENGFSAPYLFGDSNLDGSVNVADLNALANNWLGHNTWQNGDFTADGVIDEDDLAELRRNWQRSIPAGTLSSVPEPSVGPLCFLVLFYGFRRKSTDNR